jgi:hypothetical protein
MTSDTSIKIEVFPGSNDLNAMFDGNAVVWRR